MTSDEQKPSFTCHLSLITAVPKHELLRQQGVAHPIDYRTQDFEAEVERIAGRRGIDVVLDPLAGAATQKNYRLLRTGGRLIVFGFARAVKGWRRTLRALPEIWAVPKFNPLRMMRDNTMVAGFHLGRITDAVRLRHDFEEIFRMYAARAIRPLVGRTFPLTEAAEAHRFWR